MQLDTVLELTQTAPSGSVMRLVLGREFLNTLVHIQGMMDAGELVAANEGTLLHLNRVIKSGRWGFGPNPTTFIFRTTGLFDAAKFAGLIAYSLEAFKIVYEQAQQS